MAVSGVSRGIDRDRQQVYSVEDAWSSALDRGGDVDFFGSHFTLPRQQVLPDLGALQETVDRWLASASRLAWYPQCSPVRVRARQGQTRAHYEATGVIAIPLSQPWACRESVLAHELAHHLAWDAQESAHDAHFRLAMVRVAEIAFGPGAALMLRAGYDGAGLAVAHVD